MPNNNNPVELAFCIGSFVKNDLESRVICWWTKSWCPHVEGYVPGLGWVSAHQQTGKVDALPLADIDNPAAWRRVKVPYRWTEAARQFVRETIGAGYDYLSMVDFVLHDGLLAKGKEICSRFWRDVLDRCEWVGAGEPPKLLANPSPGDLVRLFLPQLTSAVAAETIALSREELKALCQRPACL